MQNSSTKEIADQLADIVLEDDKELVSFDVVSLYTNVPVNEAIVVCANLLYDGTLKKPPVDKDTFTKLIFNNQSQLKFLNNFFSLLRFDKWAGHRYRGVMVGNNINSESQGSTFNPTYIG